MIVHIREGTWSVAGYPPSKKMYKLDTLLKELKRSRYTVVSVEVDMEGTIEVHARHATDPPLGFSGS